MGDSKGRQKRGVGWAEERAGREGLPVMAGEGSLDPRERQVRAQRGLPKAELR